MSSRALSVAARAVPVAGLVAALGLLSVTVDLPAAIGLLATVDAGALAVAAGLMGAVIVLATFKIGAVLRSVEMPRAFRRVLGALLSSATLNTFVPGRGGDLFRAFLLSDHRGQLLPAVGAVAVERLLDLGTLALLGVTLGAATGRWTTAGLSAGVLAALVGGLALFGLGVRLPVLERRLASVREVLGTLARHPRELALAALLSAATWTGNMVLMVVCLRALGVDLPALEILAVAPLAILTAIVPISISGIGTRDLVLVTLLAAPGERVAAGALLYAAIQSVAMPLLGSFVLGREGFESYRRLMLEARAS